MYSSKHMSRWCITVAFGMPTKRNRFRPEVKVYGVQAEGAPSMYRSLHEHKYQTLKAASTFADGIQVKTPGELTYQLCEEYVDDIVTVSEDETAAAILSLMENQKLVAEGAGAVPVAAALFHKLPIEGKKVVCVISGGNIDVNILSRVITRGLVMSGRKANLTIALEDKPGQLQRVAEIVSRCGSNVVSVLHDGSDPNMPISSCFLKLTLECRIFSGWTDLAACQVRHFEIPAVVAAEGNRDRRTAKAGNVEPARKYESCRKSAK